MYWRNFEENTERFRGAFETRALKDCVGFAYKKPLQPAEVLPRKTLGGPAPWAPIQPGRA